MSGKARLKATVTIQLDDAIGQLEELGELLSLLGHDYQVRVEMDKDMVLSDRELRILADASIIERTQEGSRVEITYKWPFIGAE